MLLGRGTEVRQLLEIVPQHQFSDIRGRDDHALSAGQLLSAARVVEALDLLVDRAHSEYVAELVDGTCHRQVLAADRSPDRRADPGGRTERRNESQFNVGMHASGVEHVRVGLGFEMTPKKGGDPTRVGLIYAVFRDAIRRRADEFRKVAAEAGLEVHGLANLIPFPTKSWFYRR